MPAPRETVQCNSIPINSKEVNVRQASKVTNQLGITQNFKIKTLKKEKGHISWPKHLIIWCLYMSNVVYYSNKTY